MKRNLFSPIKARTSQAASAPTARGPHECVALSPDQFAAAMKYVTGAALSAVQPPKEFFPEGLKIQVLGKDETKVMLLACYAHFKGHGDLAISFFYRYRGMGLVASSALLRPWVTYEPGCDYFAGFHLDIVELFARMPMDSAGNFDPEAVRAEAIKITNGIPDYEPAVSTTIERPAAVVDQRIAA